MNLPSAVASSMYDTFSGRYPELRRVGEGKWNVLVTAASLYLASSKLREGSPEWWSNELSEVLKEELPDQTAYAMGSLDDFVTRTVDWGIDALLLERAVGYWVLFGLFRETPRASQVWLAAAIGEAIGKTSKTLARFTLLATANGSRPTLMISS